MRIDAISIGIDPPRQVNVIIEVPVGGEPIKYEMDKEAGTLVVDRFLYTAMRYPGNYGFIPHTLSNDGDPWTANSGGTLTFLNGTWNDIFSGVAVDYKLFLNVLGFVIFGALFWLTARRGATDPVCGMKVDRSTAVTASRDGHTYFFCSEHCRSKAGLS